MDNSTALDLIDELSTNIDTLTSAIEPLLKTPIQATALSLPLIDKAKLYTLSTYAIESILFSFLRLNSSSANGADAKAHPVFTELKRVQQHMQKIEAAESPDHGKRDNMSLNKEAAGRFIRAGLTGNEKYDEERAKRQEEQKLGAKRKLDELNVKIGHGEGNVEGEVKKKKGKKSKRSKKDVDVDKDEFELVKAAVQAEASPKKKKQKKSKKGGEET
jgi:exosome complex protein LRP1